MRRGTRCHRIVLAGALRRNLPAPAAVGCEAPREVDPRAGGRGAGGHTARAPPHAIVAQMKATGAPPRHDEPRRAGAAVPGLAMGMQGPPEESITGTGTASPHHPGGGGSSARVSGSSRRAGVRRSRPLLGTTCPEPCGPPVVGESTAPPAF